jgi:hypothetical protein
MEWVGRRRAGIEMRFDPADAEVLRGLVAGVRDLIGGAEPASDPLERLLGGPIGGAYAGAQGSAPPGGPPVGGPDGDPGVDPVLARLLPDGYSDDEAAAKEFRELTEGSLRAHKSETAQRVLDSLPAEGGPVCLDQDTTRAWLSALNDVRLVIGTRLGVTEETDHPDPADPGAPGYELYRWLTLLQELLVEATIGE